MFSTIASANEEEILVICNPDVAIDKIDKNHLRSIFAMRLQEWPDQKPVNVFVLEDNSPLHQKFTKKHLGFFVYQLRGAWDRQVFSGTGSPPNTLLNERSMLEKVATTPGAIGYLPRKLVDHTVKILKVEMP
ncbi:hypothetical protein [Aliikangiella sp. G2MR2-5]|uniref:hypothetical protein n=1 Tax=Aliikangiella sp. G2MR2-5 TaxID=2788943 RepID=UPI0018AB78D6|nr:hypothetical protein [Aliikangiella sp. G2MR2-5]